jgi:hypothetical protein
MKKLRIFLSVIAFAGAIGGAAASRLFVSAITGYEFVDRPAPSSDLCIDRGNICDTNGTVDCRVTQSTPILREHSNPATSCGLPLKMIP